MQGDGSSRGDLPPPPHDNVGRGLIVPLIPKTVNMHVVYYCQELLEPLLL